ncbi:B3 domain-containing protein [Canna indica]|uniref:B3 domain-containing protein n=1 Tax=Canna indica TaxID=4628 RepID=A0AAQ3L068_9LILI|nr:B3 domain-containing protein [Canna indica]
MEGNLSVSYPQSKRRRGRKNLGTHNLTTEESTNWAAELDISNAEERISPLSGKPFFSSVMSKSHVQAPHQLVLPRSIWPFLPSNRVHSTLCCQGKKWEMTYFGYQRQKRFDAGWKHFVMDNNLKIGDGCVFELMDDKNLKFKVQILRGDLPPEFVENGMISGKPILID